MEKINLKFIAKTLVLLFGLSSLCFTSCKSEDDDNEPAPSGWNEKEAKEILADGFTADFPLDFPLKAYPNSQKFKILELGEDKHADSFYTFITYDSTCISKDSTTYTVTIQYNKLEEPETVDEKEVDNIINVLKKYFYPEEIADIQVDEKTKFAGYSAHKLVAVAKGFYMEHYVFYVPSQKKVYIAIISMPELLVNTRRDELYNIASTFRIK